MINLPCPESDWPRFTALVDAAMELPEASRTQWLNDLAGEDARVKPWLERLFHGVPNLETENLLPPPSLDQTTFQAGDTVGPYRLESLLGEGGMGEVWRASRADDGPQREIALKLPHAAFLGGPFQQRFTRERDVLAALSHPHIAQLYDAGISAEGHPYLALELVRGQSVTESLRARKADLEQRIDLVRQVLAGLSYAHRRLIVHRDIKPANVLVTPEGNAKLLDFGIAKLLGADVDSDPALTGVARLATPAYAAPEQLSGGAITVATDVFSVGVLLFELCTGRRPFIRVPADNNAQAAPLASSCADAKSAGMANARHLNRNLRGDLDAVLARALALDPADRYPSADAFDDDLRRWRASLPVRARRIGWPSRAQKFIRRNPFGVTLAAILLISVLGGTAGIAWQAHRAEQQATRATAIKTFLFGLLDAGSPQAGGKRSDSITLRDLLDIGADRTEKAFPHDPVTQIDVLEAFGDIFDEIEEDGRAENIYSRRLDIARDLYGTADPRFLNPALDLADFESHALDFAKAQAVLESVRLPILQTFGPDSILRAAWLQIHAGSLRATAGARAEMTTDLQSATNIFSHHRLETGATMANISYSNALLQLAKLQMDADRLNDALATTQTMGAMQAIANPRSATAHMQYVTGLAIVLEKMGKWDAAEAIYKAAQIQAENVIGKHGGWYLNPLMHRAALADLRGDPNRAASLFHTPGANFTHKASLPERTRGAILARDGNAAEAVALLEPALVQARKNARDEDTVRITEGVLGDAYDQLGRVEEAKTALQSARNDWLKYGAPGSTATLAAQERWARFLQEHANPQAASEEFQAVLTQSAGNPSAPAALAAAGLARIALAAGRSNDADAASTQAIDILDAIKTEYDIRIRIEIWSIRAEALLAAGQSASARQFAAKAADLAGRTCVPGSKYPRRMQALLGRI